jgi:hypothetical protein
MKEEQKEQHQITGASVMNLKAGKTTRFIINLGEWYVLGRNGRMPGCGH